MYKKRRMLCLALSAVMTLSPMGVYAGELENGEAQSADVVEDVSMVEEIGESMAAAVSKNIEKVEVGTSQQLQYGNLYYTVANGEVTITGCEVAEGELILPEAIEGYPVTHIGDSAFEDCSGFNGSLTIASYFK